MCNGRLSVSQVLLKENEVLREKTKNLFKSGVFPSEDWEKSLSYNFLELYHIKSNGSIQAMVESKS